MVELAPLAAPIARRTFLQVAGLSALGLAGAQRALGAVGPAGEAPALAPASLALDPIEQLAASLDYDVEHIFRFVADDIRYEPYAGILRGARGTLASRAGNSADQALILAALLDASGVPVRFVTGALDDAGAESILAAAAVDLATAQAQAREILLEGLEESAPASGGSQAPVPPKVQAIVDRLPEIADAAREWAEARLVTGVGAIVAALEAEGVTLAEGTSALPTLERERHVWVQAATGPDWIDLDPTIAGAQPQESLATASGDPLQALPDELRHRVELAVSAEAISGSGLTREVILEHAAFADELAGVPVTFLHDRPEGISAVGLSVAGSLTGATQYLPILQVGERVLVGLTGLTFGGDGGILSDLGSAGDRQGETTAEWLEVRITAPDGTVEAARRTLFDRAGEAARAGGTLDPASIPPVVLVDLDPGSPAEFLPARTLHFLAVVTGRSSLEALDLAGAEDPGLAHLQRGGRLYHARREAVAAELGLPRGVRGFIDAPSVVDLSLALEAADTSTPVTVGLDILHRRFGHLPVSGTPAAAPPGVVSGVLSHVAERLALGEGLPADLAPSALGVSVGAVLEAAVAQGIGLRVLRDPAAVDDLGLPAEVADRLRVRLASGWAAVIPAARVRLGDRERLGWWLVDPATGRTIDELDDGRGAELLEYAINYVHVALRTLPAFARAGLCFLAAFTAATQILLLGIATARSGSLWPIAGTPLVFPAGALAGAVCV